MLSTSLCTKNGDNFGTYTHSKGFTLTTIRIATVADIPAIFSVRTSVRENHMSLEELSVIGVTPDTLPAMLSGDGRAWVAEENCAIVAFAMAERSEATIFAMFVHPEHEGKGHGRALMHAAESWLFAQGCERIWLLTDNNPQVRANGFYQHLGWEKQGVQEDGQLLYIKQMMQ